MPLHKTAVAFPKDLLLLIEAEAREQKTSRNQLMISILSEAMRKRRDRAVTARLNALFAHGGEAEEQVRGAEELDRVGSSWEDERW